MLVVLFWLVGTCGALLARRIIFALALVAAPSWRLMIWPIVTAVYRCPMSSPVVSRLFPSGAWEVSDIVAGYWVRRTYYGYTRREAVALFRREVLANV